MDHQLSNESNSASNSGAAEDGSGALTAADVRQEEYERAMDVAVNAPPPDHKIVGCRDAKPNVNPQKVRKFRILIFSKTAMPQILVNTIAVQSRKIIPYLHIHVFSYCYYSLRAYKWFQSNNKSASTLSTFGLLPCFKKHCEVRRAVNLPNNCMYLRKEFLKS